MSLKVDRHKPVPLFFELLHRILIDNEETINVYEPSEVISDVTPIKRMQKIFWNWVQLWKPLYNVPHRHELSLLLCVTYVNIELRLNDVQRVKYRGLCDMSERGHCQEGQHRSGLCQANKLEILVEKLAIGDWDAAGEEETDAGWENRRDSSPKTFISPLILKNVFTDLSIWFEPWLLQSVKLAV